MAGVASGLALATTLMAMQVADSMSMRPTIHVVSTPIVETLDNDSGFLGIRYVPQDGVIVVKGVLHGTPAEMVGLRPGDRVLSINGDPIRSDVALQSHVFGAHPGTELVLTYERDGVEETVHPVLASWPVHGGS